MLARHLTLMMPVCVMLGLLPATWGIRIAVIGLALLGSTFALMINSGDVRQARLRQHGLPVPNDAERGHPPH